MGARWVYEKHTETTGVTQVINVTEPVTLTPVNTEERDDYHDDRHGRYPSDSSENGIRRCQAEGNHALASAFPCACDALQRATWRSIAASSSSQFALLFFRKKMYTNNEIAITAVT